MPGNVGAVVVVWREARYLAHVLDTALDAGVEVVVVWSRRPWSWTSEVPEPSGWTSEVATVLAARAGRSNLHVLRWSGDLGLQATPARADRAARSVAHAVEHALGCDASIVLDADHLYEPDPFRAAIERVCEEPGFWSAKLVTYWKDPAYRVGTPNDTVLFAVPVEWGEVDVEDNSASRGLLNLTCYHASYVRTDAEMHEKLHSWGHSDLVPSDWYERVWLAQPHVGQRVGFTVPESWIVWGNPDPVPDFVARLP